MLIWTTSATPSDRRALASTTIPFAAMSLPSFATLLSYEVSSVPRLTVITQQPRLQSGVGPTMRDGSMMLEPAMATTLAGVSAVNALNKVCKHTYKVGERGHGGDNRVRGCFQSNVWEMYGRCLFDIDIG